MVDQDPKAVPDADAEVLAALLRLAVKSSGRQAVQEEIARIPNDPSASPNYSVPFGARITQIKKAAGLE
jgi:hypothetical protein